MKKWLTVLAAVLAGLGAAVATLEATAPPAADAQARGAAQPPSGSSSK